MRPELRHCCLVLIVLLFAGGMASAQEVLRDPTRPYTAPEHSPAAPVRYAVNAIINSDQRRLAIVNGRRVGIGDTVDGAEVKAIHKSEVVLLVDGREKTLTLNRGGRQR